MESKIKLYHKLLKQLEADNKDSDDEVKELEIKTKINAFVAENNTTRLSAELLAEAFRWRLSRNDCQNRGYVLDGYPICYNTA